MNTDKNYLSEFEKEFELENFSDEYDQNTNSSNEIEDEIENEFSDQSNDELDIHDEYELDSESDDESDDEYEFESENQDSESKNYLQEYNSPDQEFEDRIYAALSGEHESSFEMEQEIDRVLHEMEIEYFWKSAKNFWNKHKNKFKFVAKNFLPGGTLTHLAKFAGGNLRGLLKSDLFKKGLSMAANAYLPGVGGAIAGKLLNNETPNANNARAQARQAVRVAKDAYRNLATLMPNIRSGNVPDQISRFSKQALATAQSKHSVYKGKSKKVIAIKPNSIVVVRPDRIIIYS